MKHIDKILAGLALVGAAGCSSDRSGDDLGVGAKLSVDYLGDSDVVGFHYLIERVSCNPGDPIEPFSFEALVDLQDQLAPGGVTVLGVVDGESGHIFADVFVSLDPGCYDVTATPVSEMDVGAGTYTASADCAAASADGIEVLDEQTTDAPLLISQCEGDPNGAGDFPAALNHPPQFTVSIDDKFGFTCEVLEVCATVSDPDNDPLELDWTQTSGGTLYEPISVGALTQTGQVGGIRQYEQCAEFVSEAVDDYEFSVTVYDLLGDGTRIEDALEPGQQSQATMSFPLYTSSGVEPACVDGTGATASLGDAIDRRAGCTFQTADQYYCDAANAAADGFDLSDTCPGGTFDASAAYPACTCDTLVYDDFNRPDSTSIGGPAAGWTELVGDAAIVGGELVGSTTGFTYLTLDQGASYELDHLRVRMKMRRGHNLGVALFGINGDNAMASPQYHPGTGIANAGLLYYDGASAAGTAAIPGLDAVTDYYLEMLIIDGEASVTVATGDYAGEGGTVLADLPPVVVSAPVESFLRLSLDDNGAADDVAVDEVSVESCGWIGG